MAVSPLHAQVQRGKATFYSKRATGARSASGERIHHDSLTCAHRSYPFGTLLRVTNPANGNEVVVRVTDRGPFARGRIIDLSWSAAERLGILGHGVAIVEVEPVGMAEIPASMNQRIELPEMDFEVTEAGYSFIDKWKDIGDDKSDDSDADASNIRQSKPKVRAQHKSAAHAPQKSPVKSKRQTNKNEPAENNISRIFSRIKNWSEGLFK